MFEWDEWISSHLEASHANPLRTTVSEFKTKLIFLKGWQLGFCYWSWINVQINLKWTLHQRTQWSSLEPFCYKAPLLASLCFIFLSIYDLKLLHLVAAMFLLLFPYIRIALSLPLLHVFPKKYSVECIRSQAGCKKDLISSNMCRAKDSHKAPITHMMIRVVSRVSAVSHLYFSRYIWLHILIFHRKGATATISGLGKAFHSSIFLRLSRWKYLRIN